MVAKTGVWNRSETVVSFSGASRSNDQANIFRVPSMNPVGVHHRIASTKHKALHTRRHCGPGRTFTSAGRYGLNGRFHGAEPPPRAMNTDAPKKLNPKYLEFSPTPSTKETADT